MLNWTVYGGIIYHILFYFNVSEPHSEPVACAKSHATLVSADHGLPSPAVMSKQENITDSLPNLMKTTVALNPI